MRVLVVGASGMVGQGAVRESLLAPDVEQVIALGRSSLPSTAATAIPGCESKLKAIVVPDLFHLSDVEADLTGVDACFFCLGLSSTGVSRAEYQRITYDLAISIAGTLFRLNPQMVLVFVSGAGASVLSRFNWARVKGAAENALLARSNRTFVLRPGMIEPLDGIRSRTRMYDFLLRHFRGMFSLLRRLFPDSITSTAQMGRAMLALARQGSTKRILEARDITALAPDGLRAPVH